MKQSFIEIEGIGKVEVRTSSRARNVRMKVKGGELSVSKPRGVPLSAVKHFVRRNSEWARQKIETSKNERLIHDGDELIPGELLVRLSSQDKVVKTHATELGEQLVVEYPKTLDWDSPEVQKEIIESVVPHWRKAAKKYLPKRLEELATKYGYEYGDVRVKFIHTRWGSCSSKNNINLNIQLMRLKHNLIDHVILHELVHTRHHNHSAAFWQAFETVEPGARHKSKLLKSYQLF